MPLSYSVDLHWRIVWLSITGVSPDHIAQSLNVSVRTVYSYVNLFYTSGDVIPSPHRTGPACLVGDQEEMALLQIILENPGRYLCEIQQELWQKSGVWLHASTICKSLHCMGCTRQKIQHIALQRSDQCRAKFVVQKYQSMIPVCSCGLMRLDVIVKGSTVIQLGAFHRILVRGTRYSAIGIMSLGGVMDVHIMAGTVNGERFSYFVTETLLPISSRSMEITPCLL